MHDQRGLHAHRRAVAGIDALHFTRDQAVSGVVGGGAAVFLGQRGAEQAERAHLVHDLAMEFLVPVGLQHARHQLVLAVIARDVADRDLLLAELVVEEERILPVERLGIGTDALGGALDRGGGEGHVFSWLGLSRLIRDGQPRQPTFFAGSAPLRGALERGPPGPLMSMMRTWRSALRMKAPRSGALPAMKSRPSGQGP